MEHPSPASRFAHLSRGQAQAVAVITIALIGFCLIVALTQATLPLEDETATKQKPWDGIFYQSIVEQVRGGEGYYDAVAREFRHPRWKGFQPTSMFNWRLPTYAWVIGGLPDPVWARGLLVVLILGTIAMAFALVQRELDGLSALLLLFMVGSFAWSLLGDIFLFTELWAGALIALSICAYALGMRATGVAAGLSALFWRELALPYCLFALIFAVRQRRRAEAAAWMIGLALFGAFFALHIQEVARRVPSGGALQTSTWIRFGGAAFLIGTVQIGNVFLAVLPAWVSALVLPLALLGLIGWRGELGDRASLTTLAYLAAFAVVGQPFNAYWGLLYAPLLALGLPALPLVFRDLFRALKPRSAVVSTPM